MIGAVPTLLEQFEDVLWGFFGVPVLMLLGIYLTFHSNFFQIRKFPAIIKTFFGYFRVKNRGNGVHPLHAFFACIGGCIGIGNIVGICTAVQIGGPGALFWIWITAICGMIVKYAEVYLGVRHRVMNKKGQYSGGPMYFLALVTSQTWVPVIICLLLCIYGVEVYQFSVITQTLSDNLNVNRELGTFFLLFLVLFAGSGGISRVGKISGAIIPIFIILYMGMGLWVLGSNITVIPSILKDVFSTAFTGSAAAGGFIGSTLINTISQGVRRGCYTGDVGVGYASVIHSESAAESPEKQASLVILDVFLDTFFICTMSVLVVLVTGVWSEAIPASMLVQSVLAQYFPGMHFFMPFFLFLLGYTTINAYFCVGLKCAEMLSSKYGRPLYYAYAIIALACFSYVDTKQAQAVMSISGGLLLVINCWGIFRLHREISYEFVSGKDKDLETDPIQV
ncbi:MAG TPA: amino acid carrier protein [Waddliaceae bacterium]